MARSRPPRALSTERLRLRAVVEQDAEALGTVLSRNVAYLEPWLPWAACEPLPLDERRERLRLFEDQWESETDFGYVLRLAGKRAPLGMVGMHRRVGQGGLELGYWLDEQHAGHGYMSEAVAALVHVAFRLDGIVRIQIHADPANAPSLAIPKRLGFTHEGTLRSRFQRRDGTWRDTSSWSLLATDPLPPTSLRPR